MPHVQDQHGRRLCPGERKTVCIRLRMASAPLVDDLRGPVAPVKIQTRRFPKGWHWTYLFDAFPKKFPVGFGTLSLLSRGRFGHRSSGVGRGGVLSYATYGKRVQAIMGVLWRSIVFVPSRDTIKRLM